MKKVLLFLALLFVCFVSYSQKINKKFLEGTWETEFHVVEFKTINKEEFKITIVIKENNKQIDVISYKFHGDALYMETYYKENDWKAIGKMIVMDENTLVENVVSPATDLLIYKRKKIN
jgi:hypothetical protein